MIVTGVSCVKNEGDVIEAFVRHNLALLDRLILIDHGSTDNTADILRALVAEGLPVRVHRDDSIGKHQAVKMTRLMREAAADGADWIILLDADEFLSCPPGPLTCPDADEAKVWLTEWATYCPQPGDVEDEINPVIRIRHRLRAEPENQGDRRHHLKVFVHKEFALDPNIKVSQGNHFLLRRGEMIDARIWDGWKLAHFSLRSPGQYLAKLSMGYLQHFLDRSPESPVGTFYLRHLEPAMRDYDNFHRQFHQLLPSYLHLSHLPPAIQDPLAYRGGPLRHTGKRSDTAMIASGFFPCALNFAEQAMSRNGHAFPEEKNAEITLELSDADGTILAQNSALAAPGCRTVVKLRLPAKRPPCVLKISAPAGVLTIQAIDLEMARLDNPVLSGVPLREMFDSVTGVIPLYHATRLVWLKSWPPIRCELQADAFPLEEPVTAVSLALSFTSHPGVAGGLLLQQEGLFIQKHTSSDHSQAKLHEKIRRQNAELRKLKTLSGKCRPKQS